jgi:hypothetical protein
VFWYKFADHTLQHLQLRNLLWATSKHDVYVMQNYSVMHWSSLLGRGKEVLNVAGQVAPTQVTDIDPPPPGYVVCIIGMLIHT